MSVSVKEKWDDIIQYFRDEFNISEVSYNTWIRPISVIKEDDHTVTLCIDASKVAAFSISHIEKKYSNDLKISIASVTGKFCELQFVLSTQIEEEEKENKESAAFSGSSVMVSAETYANLNSQYSFDTFVIGQNNNLALVASLSVAEAPGESYNPLFIYGGPGLGKTHLMHSIARYIIEHNPQSKVVYVPSEKFTNELIDSIRNSTKNNTTPAEFRNKYRNVDVLLIDDIQFIIGKEGTQEEFFHTFNELHEAKKQIIISSDKPPKDMVTLEERLRSRFQWGLTVDIQQPDYETRMAILKKKREGMSAVNITDEVLDYIATNVKSNIRELEGALTRVNALSCLKKKEITIALAEEALKDILSPDQNKIIDMDSIINVVIEHFSITQQNFYSSSRTRTFAYPRQIAMYLCKRLTSSSITDIGKKIGGKDHATVIYGIEKIEKALATDVNLQNTIDVLIKKINPPV